METLKKYSEEGWRARIKTVKGHKYIIIRLRGKDKSLGPYNLALWKKLETLGMTSTKRIKHVPVETSEKSLANLQKQISQLKRRQSQLAGRIERWKKYPRTELIKFRKKLKELEDTFSKMDPRGTVKAENVIYTFKDEKRKTTTITLIEYLCQRSCRHTGAC